MMKIILILLLLLNVSSCSKKPTLQEQLFELGYDQEDIEYIELLDEDKQELFLENYNDKLIPLMKTDNYKDENLEKYLKYYGEFDNDKVVELVNNNMINDSNVKILKEMYASDYFIKSNEELYLKYLGKYESLRKTMEVVNTKRYKELFSDITPNDISKDYLMLVNKYYTLPSDYEPDDLVYVEDEYGRGMTRERVYEAFKQLHDDALELGYNIIVVSAYRSYDYQLGLYEMYCESDPVEVVDTYCARPGLSEHQTGLCLDVSIPGLSIDDFYQCGAAPWLEENAPKYGFIIRFPKDKEDITGYQWESWHIRYLGEQVAQDVYDRHITYDEYYACFVEDYE